MRFDCSLNDEELLDAFHAELDELMLKYGAVLYNNEARILPMKDL